MPLSLLYGFDQQIARWVSQRTQITNFGECRAIGVVRNGKIIAGVVYYQWRDGNIEVTVAADEPRWASRTVLRDLFAYPFLQLKCRRMTCIVAADNEASLRLCDDAGWVREGRSRKVFDQTDGVIFGMLPEECRWLSAK